MTSARQRSAFVMFVSEEIRLQVGFTVASARLANLARGGALSSASADAYADGASLLIRVGPAPGVSRLVHARFRDLVTRGDSAVLTLRWEAEGAAGRLFPALDADITITPAGDDATLMRLNGVYRAPLGSVGAGLDAMVLHRVASATIRQFAGRVASLITNPSAEGAEGRQQWSWLPEWDTPQ